MALEQAIRPFQAPGTLATRRIIAVNSQISVTRALITWGAAGAMPTPTEEDAAEQFAFKVEQCDENNTEQTRKTHTTRVTQDGNPDNYVDVELTNSISFQKKATNKLVGSLVSETTAFTQEDPFAGTPFGDVPQGDNCK